MYFSKAAVVLASVPAFLSLISVGSVLADERPSLNSEPTEASVPIRLSQSSDTQPSERSPRLRLLGTPASASSGIAQQKIPLSPGDRLSLIIPGIGGEEFTGEYEVNFDGSLNIPFSEPIPVLGLTIIEAESRVQEALLAQQLFLPGQLRVSLQVLDYAPVQVAVTGAVFEPGRLLLSQETSVLADATGDVVELPGDNPLERYLTSALKAIGGVKPTADVSKVQVLRGTESVIVDLSGVFSGDEVVDFPLVAGDQIIIPDSGEFQIELVKPSQITPDSIDLYVSNVTQPGGGAVLTGAGDINVASFEYGTNLAQALVSARCVGGTRATNASRRAVLIQTDDATGGLTTTEYNVNKLVSDSTQSVESNPLLMPDDAIACYDSRNTNIRGILGTVTDFLNPINLLNNLFDDDN
ncbi:MAG: polysaccharide biosynthesis/export family protein [Cyanobacteria bacterium P01_D01_bin.105]